MIQGTRHILGIYSGAQSHTKAAPRPYERHLIGNPKPRQSRTKATPKPHQSHTKATPKPPPPRQNPKAEGRKPKEIRSPKSEVEAIPADQAPRGSGHSRISGFCLLY